MSLIQNDMLELEISKDVIGDFILREQPITEASCLCIVLLEEVETRIVPTLDRATGTLGDIVFIKFELLHLTSAAADSLLIRLLDLEVVTIAFINVLATPFVHIFRIISSWLAMGITTALWIPSGAIIARAPSVRLLPVDEWIVLRSKVARE